MSDAYRRLVVEAGPARADEIADAATAIIRALKMEPTAQGRIRVVLSRGRVVKVIRVVEYELPPRLGDGDGR